MLCDSCPKKAFCSALCQEAKEYANQDQVKLKEKTIGLPKYGRLPEPLREIPLTKREKQIVTLFALGLTRKDICKTLNITRGNLRIMVKRLQRKYNDFSPL